MNRRERRSAERERRRRALAPLRCLGPMLEHLRFVPTDGGLHHIDVQHDDWCAIWFGGLCDCDPIVASGPLVDRKYTPPGGDR